ncbi:Ff.00g079590.m01.CDS01 [Fusarium sp. VM40]|nr:Ff.00g079590.m01.CDS01 [Fusarium sp. VM40]
MSSRDDSNMIKPPSFSPWSSVNKPQTNGPNPARVVSDIIENAAVKASAAGILSSNPRIQAAQSEWERKSQGQPSMPSSTGPPGASSLIPPQLKRNSPASDMPAAKRQTTENIKDIQTNSRESAHRFTEAEVARQMAELTGASIKKSAMYLAPQHAAPMHFATGAELLKKYTSQSSPSPAPTQTPIPVPVLPASAPVSTPVPAPGPAKSPDAPSSGDRIVAIPMADADRLYSLYPLPEGGTVSARGAIIPPNYKLHDDPDLQFICPVRDCRRLFNGLKGLGGHFGAGHCLTTFNDNGDGTLTKVGTYQRNGPGGTPGIVVSRNPLPPDAPPPVDPGLSTFASAHQIRMSRAVEMVKKTTRLQGSTSQSPTPPVLSDPTIKSYLHQYLSPAQRTHRREDITFMLALPRKRDLPESWKQIHRGGNLDVNHYACALAYLTGRVVTGSEQCIANTTRPSSRLSEHCIALPSSMPLSAKQAFSTLESCVGCRYWCHHQRRSNGCDWCPEPKRGRGTSGGSARSSSSEVSQGTDIDIEDVVEEPMEPVEPVQEPKRAKRRSSIQNTQVTMREYSIGIAGRPSQAGVELEMEDWEVAPGRMKDILSENIAFSNSYLTSGQPVTVSEDISFNVIVLKPGSASHWKVEDDKLRTCSVAAGKVRVTMGEQTFQLGPNGMFVVRPGQACKVENRLYLDSVVHCTTIGDFSLQ